MFRDLPSFFDGHWAQAPLLKAFPGLPQQHSRFDKAVVFSSKQRPCLNVPKHFPKVSTAKKQRERTQNKNYYELSILSGIWIENIRRIK